MKHIPFGGCESLRDTSVLRVVTLEHIVATSTDKTITSLFQIISNQYLKSYSFMIVGLNLMKERVK